MFNGKKSIEDVDRSLLEDPGSKCENARKPDCSAKRAATEELTSSTMDDDPVENTNRSLLADTGSICENSRKPVCSVKRAATEELTSSTMDDDPVENTNRSLLADTGSICENSRKPVCSVKRGAKEEPTLSTMDDDPVENTNRSLLADTGSICENSRKPVCSVKRAATEELTSSTMDNDPVENTNRSLLADTGSICENSRKPVCSVKRAAKEEPISSTIAITHEKEDDSKLESCLSLSVSKLRRPSLDSYLPDVVGPSGNDETRPLASKQKEAAEDSTVQRVNIDQVNKEGKILSNKSDMSETGKVIKRARRTLPQTSAMSDVQESSRKSRTEIRKSATEYLTSSKGVSSIVIEQTKTSRSGRIIKPIARSPSIDCVIKDRKSRKTRSFIQRTPQGAASKTNMSVDTSNYSDTKGSKTSKPRPSVTKEVMQLSAEPEAGGRADIDGEFEVECVVKHNEVPNDSRKLLYVTKWLGYPSENNTSEEECAFLTFRPIYQYWYDIYHQKAADYKYALGSLIQHELQMDNIRFFIYDPMFHKNMISIEYVGKYCWDNMILSFKPTASFPDMGALLYRYTAHLKYISRLCPGLPFIEILNTVDNALPLPFSCFIPINLSPEMDFMPEPEDVFSAETYHGLLPTHERMNSTVRMIMDLLSGNYPAENPINSMLCDEVSMQLKFIPMLNRSKPQSDHINLRLYRHVDKYWVLVTKENIQKGTFISPICGDIVHVSEAEKSFRTEGEMVAFKHFLRFPDYVDHCLDRRKRSDFTRYLSHSCYPNCVIHSVVIADSNDRWAPMLYLVAREPITAGTRLTVDFYSKLPRPGKLKPLRQVDWDARLKLHNKTQDHIWCMCSADPRYCRGVLWAEDLPDGKYKDNKDKKIKKTRIGTGTFNGLECIEREWEVCI